MAGFIIIIDVHEMLKVVRAIKQAADIIRLDNSVLSKIIANHTELDAIQVTFVIIDTKHW